MAVDTTDYLASRPMFSDVLSGALGDMGKLQEEKARKAKLSSIVSSHPNANPYEIALLMAQEGILPQDQQPDMFKTGVATGNTYMDALKSKAELELAQRKADQEASQFERNAENSEFSSENRYGLFPGMPLSDNSKEIMRRRIARKNGKASTGFGVGAGSGNKKAMSDFAAAINSYLGSAPPPIPSAP